MAQLVQESVSLAFVVFVLIFGEGAGAAAAVESDALLLPPSPPPPPPPPSAGPLQQHGHERVGRRMRRASDELRRTPPPSLSPSPPILIDGEGMADYVRSALQEDRAFLCCGPPECAATLTADVVINARAFNDSWLSCLDSRRWRRPWTASSSSRAATAG